MDLRAVQDINETSKRDRWPFPKTFEALKAAGVISYTFDVLTCETKFLGEGRTSFSESIAVAGPVFIPPSMDAFAVAAAIKRHIVNRTTFLAFRNDAALAGVRYWEIDMSARTCTYFGKDSASYVERVPPFSGD